MTNLSIRRRGSDAEFLVVAIHWDRLVLGHSHMIVRPHDELNNSSLALRGKAKMRIQLPKTWGELSFYNRQNMYDDKSMSVIPW
jgi:hypothetical protein